MSSFTQHVNPNNIFMIIFENSDFKDVIAKPFFKAFAGQGILFTNSHGVIHPSQPNYFALTAGDTFVISNDPVDLDVTNLVDLLESKNISWKAYSENYPGNCYKDDSICELSPADPSQCSVPMAYVRKHNPFISYVDVQNNPKRCKNIVDASQLQLDIVNGEVPQFAYYVPNMQNGAHNTDLDYADRYLMSTFMPLFRDPNFIKDRIFIITFDESNDQTDPINHIYTAFWGPNVKSGQVVDEYIDHYTILRTIEEHFQLGTLGRNDLYTRPIINYMK